MGLTTAEMQARYDAIIHLVTAADGADEHYCTQVDGEPRYESVEEARDKDIRLRRAYDGHENWVMIDNDGGFEQKLDAALKAVLALLIE